jgi:hypothetical protein
VGSLSQFEEYVGPLLRGHLSAGKGIGGIGFLKGVENADYFLHSPILRWLFDFGGGFSTCGRKWAGARRCSTASLGGAGSPAVAVIAQLQMRLGLRVLS